MAGPNDRQDRRDAMKLFIAVAIVVLVLIGLGLTGFLLFAGPLASRAAATFEPGLGLKDAALIATGVSFVGIVILTVVSGGDAIFGELPFTLLGFFLFFAFFWLMTAWVF